MRLNELFTDPAPYKQAKSEGGQIVLNATLSDSSVLKMVFFQMGTGVWKFAFSRATPQAGMMSRIKSAVGMSPGLNKASYGKTGDGNEIEVFSTVKQAVSDFWREHNPRSMVFTADKGEGDDTSRTSLYQALVRRLFPTSRFDVKVEDSGGFDLFVIKRKGLDDEAQ